VTPDSLKNYIGMGYGGWLEEYYNPQHFFDEVYFFSSGEDREWRELGMQIVPVQKHRIWESIRTFGIDIVRAYGGGLACEMVCSNKVNGVPVVVSVHDRRPEYLSDMIKKTDIAFGVSDEVVKLIATKYQQRDRIWLLPNRVNLSVMKPQGVDSYSDLNRRYPFKFRVLHVGRKDLVKNIDTLIRALKILGPEYCLLAIGKGDLSPYTELANAEGVEEQFFSIEAVKNEELPRYYSWASCLCHPSRSEAMSIALIEALACGTVIVTLPLPRGGTYQHLQDGIVFDGGKFNTWPVQ
jgi:glycosyltransferase involved in cell wall biosynthesis